MTALLGIDYGGTRTKLVLRATADRRILAREEVATGDLPDLAGHVRSFVGEAQVQRFGMSVAGTFDAVTGVVGRSTNMPWLDGTAPADVLAELVAIPGVAVQDGIATAIAEARIGAGRGVQDVFVIALGTGIAGAHVVGGEVRAGAHGAAGEIGHLCIGGPHSCSCGQTGCLETLIGGAQLGRRWVEEASGQGAAAAAASLTGAATAREVVAAAEVGDHAAQQVLDRGARALARALLHVSALIDPGVLVFGGGLARSPEWTVHPAVRFAQQAATFHELPQVRLAELGVWAGAHGALLYAAGAEDGWTRGHSADRLMGDQPRRG